MRRSVNANTLASKYSHRRASFHRQIDRGRRGRPGMLLGVLEAAQERNRYKYLPLETLHYIASKMEMSLGRVYSVATFYALFNLQPQGENNDLHLPRYCLPHARIAQPSPRGTA